MIIKSEMYPHQKEAYEKLKRLKVGALYMEMGTGKTRTALELIKLRLDLNKIDHVIWLCPCTMLDTDDLLDNINEHSDLAEAPGLLTLMGIETLSTSERACRKLLSIVSTKRTFIIIDESNLVKNHNAMRTRHILQIAEQCKYRLILNGTPISKNEKDLFAQWYMLDWRILGYMSFYSFAANHLEYDPDRPGRIRRVLNVDYLTDKIAPYTYMVKKEDIKEILPLPCKTYRTAYFELTQDQESHYAFVRDLFLASLLYDEERIGSAAIYRTFTALQDVTSGRRITSEVDEKIQHEPMFENIADNPRIKCLLDEIDGTEDKIIIWCKFTNEVMDIVHALTEKYGEGSAIPFFGKTTRKQRRLAKERFQGKAQFFVANKACVTYGLNLQFCHHMIYYNNDWDWATRAQSEDRVHRAGQTETVRIVDICANSTIDERVLDCLSRKERLSDCFKEALKTRNIYEWIDGKDTNDTNRTDGDTEKRGRERICKSPRDREGGRVLATALSDKL